MVRGGNSFLTNQANCIISTHSIHSKLILLVSGIIFFFFFLHYLQFVSNENKESLYFYRASRSTWQILSSWKTSLQTEVQQIRAYIAYIDIRSLFNLLQFHNSKKIKIREQSNTIHILTNRKICSVLHARNMQAEHVTKSKTTRDGLLENIWSTATILQFRWG